MGSLMSGWSSSVLSDKEVRLVRNRSLTRDQVEAFWRQHGRRPPTENGEAAAGGSPLAGSTISPLLSPGAEIPLAAGQLKVMTDEVHASAARREEERRRPVLAARSRRWACSSPPPPPSLPPARPAASCWAFLNEPPKEEVVQLGRRARTMSFACDQFHAARIVTGNA